MELTPTLKSFGFTEELLIELEWRAHIEDSPGYWSKCLRFVRGITHNWGELTHRQQNWLTSIMEDLSKQRG